MRIGYDAKRAFFNHRGLGNYSRDTIRIMSNFMPTDDCYLFSPKAQGGIRFPLTENCHIVTPQGYISKTFNSLWRTKTMCNDIRKLQLQVYHGLSHELPMGIEKTGVRSVLTMHDLIWVKHPEFYPLIDRILYTKKYRRSCMQADAIIATSQQTKDDLVALWHIDEKKISVVYQGCNPIFSTRATQEQKDSVRRKYQLPAEFILNVGAIEARKNQIRILQALKQLKNDIPLVIVGKSTDYQPTLLEAIAANRLTDRVLLINEARTDEMPAIYQMASLFVFPSLSEGFGIPIVEALQSEIPVIAAKGSCLEESGGNCCQYFDPNDTEELAMLIDKTLEDKELQTKMRQNSIEHLKLFSDETIAKKIHDIYDSNTF